MQFNLTSWRALLVLLQIQDVWEFGLRRLNYLSGCSKAKKILHREQFQMTKNPRNRGHSS